jgi:hypothetical protein
MGERFYRSEAMNGPSEKAMEPIKAWAVYDGDGLPYIFDRPSKAMEFKRREQIIVPVMIVAATALDAARAEALKEAAKVCRDKADEADDAYAGCLEGAAEAIEALAAPVQTKGSK